MCRLQLSRGIRAMWLHDVCIGMRNELLKSRPADCTLIVEGSSFFPPSKYLRPLKWICLYRKFRESNKNVPSSSIQKLPSRLCSTWSSSSAKVFGRMFVRWQLLAARTETEEAEEAEDAKESFRGRFEFLWIMGQLLEFSLFILLAMMSSDSQNNVIMKQRH